MANFAKLSSRQAIIATTISETANVDRDPAAFVIVPVESLPLEIPAPCPLYINVAGQFIMFRNSGDVLTQARLDAFLKKGVETIHIPKTEWTTFLTHLEKTHHGPRPLVSPQVTADRLRNLLLCHWRDMQEKHELFPSTFEALKRSGETLAELILTNPQVAKPLIKGFKEVSLYLADHHVNAGVIATSMALRMGMWVTDLKKIILAGLFHRVGQLDTLDQKATDALNPTEEGSTHVRRSAEILKTLGAPPEVVITALQINERLDGSGKPSALRGDRIQLYARICAMADVWSTLLFHPTLKMPTREEALLRLKTLEGKLDPDLIPILIETIS